MRVRRGKQQNTRTRPTAARNSGYSHHGAATGKAWSRGWDATGGSPREDIGLNLPELRQRCRDLYMGSPLSRAAVDRVVLKAVGHELRVQPAPDPRVLGLSKEAANAWAQQTRLEFSALWADRKEACDALALNTLGEQSALALLSWLQSGDIFALLPMEETPDSLYALRVHLIEADRVCNPTGQQDRPDLMQGVVLDPRGRTVGYEVCNVHPLGKLMGVEKRWSRVPAIDPLSGRRNILHAFVGERPEQRRGVPFLSPVIQAVKQLTRYTDAELAAAVVASYYTVFITKENAGDDPGDRMPATDAILTPTERLHNIELGSATVEELLPGESISTATPGRPNANYDQFVTAISRSMGAALGIPHEVLMQAFNSSYSASRAALLEAWALFKRWRHLLVINLLQPIYEEWLIEAVLRGRIDCPGFLDDPLLRAAWSRAQWLGPTMGMIDPLKEVLAAEKRMTLGISTLEREAQEMTNTQWLDNIEQRGMEIASMLQAGMIADPAADQSALIQLAAKD